RHLPCAHAALVVGMVIELTLLVCGRAQESEFRPATLFAHFLNRWPERCVKAKISAKLKCDAQNNDEGLKEETRTMNLEDHPTVRRLSRMPERANQYPSEVVLDGAWLRRLASNCFVANIPKCISIRSRSGCAKTAGTN